MNGRFLQLKRVIYIALLGLFLSGCMRGCSSVPIDPPQDQLHKYITLAVNAQSLEDRAKLVELTAEDLKAKLVNMSDAAFKKAYIDRRYEIQKLDWIVQNNISDKETEIEFRLAYKYWNPGERAENAPLIEVKNRAHMKLLYGKWVITRVENLDTSMEWNVGLPVMEASLGGKTPEEVLAEPPVEIESNRGP